MKTTIFTILLGFFTLLTGRMMAEEVAIEPATGNGQNLDLIAVLSIFKESNDLEDFEKKLNRADQSINNLDLNNDSLVDYIRVLETVEGDYRLIVLQAVIGNNEFQDVAYINVEKKADDDVRIQCEGNEDIYGPNYYVEPEPRIRVHVYAWPIWGWVYRPYRVVYYSPYYWGYYPTYYSAWHPYPYYQYYNTVVVYRTDYYYTTQVVYVPRRQHVHHPRRSQNVVIKPYEKHDDINYGPRGGTNTNGGGNTPRGQAPGVNQGDDEVRKAKPGEPKVISTDRKVETRDTKMEPRETHRPSMPKPGEPIKKTTVTRTGPVNTPPAKNDNRVETKPKTNVPAHTERPVRVEEKTTKRPPETRSGEVRKGDVPNRNNNTRTGGGQGEVRKSTPKSSISTQPRGGSNTEVRKETKTSPKPQPKSQPATKPAPKSEKKTGQAR